MSNLPRVAMRELFTIRDFNWFKRIFSLSLCLSLSLYFSQKVQVVGAYPPLSVYLYFQYPLIICTLMYERWLVKCLILCISRALVLWQELIKYKLLPKSIIFIVRKIYTIYSIFLLLPWIQYKLSLFCVDENVFFYGKI